MSTYESLLTTRRFIRILYGNYKYFNLSTKCEIKIQIHSIYEKIWRLVSALAACRASYCLLFPTTTLITNFITICHEFKMNSISIFSTRFTINWVVHSEKIYYNWISYSMVMCVMIVKRLIIICLRKPWWLFLCGGLLFFGWFWLDNVVVLFVGVATYLCGRMTSGTAVGRHWMIDILQVVLVVEDLFVAAAWPIFDVVHGADFTLGLNVDLLGQDLYGCVVRYRNME